MNSEEIERAASGRQRRWATPWHLWTPDISVRITQLEKELDDLYADKRRARAQAGSPQRPIGPHEVLRGLPTP